MSPIDVQRIEEELDLELPAAYAELLKNYPNRLASTKLKGKFGPADSELLNDPDRIIELNESVPVMDWGIDWPDEQFVIGEDGCGNYYTIDLDDEDPPVSFLNHETCEFEETAASLAEFIEDLIAKYNSLNDHLR